MTGLTPKFRLVLDVGSAERKLIAEYHTDDWLAAALRANNHDNLAVQICFDNGSVVTYEANEWLFIRDEIIRLRAELSDVRKQEAAIINDLDRLIAKMNGGIDDDTCD